MLIHQKDPLCKYNFINGKTKRFRTHQIKLALKTNLGKGSDMQIVFLKMVYLFIWDRGSILPTNWCKVQWLNLYNSVTLAFAQICHYVIQVFNFCKIVQAAILKHICVRNNKVTFTNFSSKDANKMSLKWVPVEKSLLV